MSEDNSADTVEEPAEELSTKPDSNNEGGLSDAELKALEDAFNNAEGPEDIATKAQAVEPAPQTVPATPAAASDTTPAAKAAAPSATTQYLRVNVDVLENLMTMVSELVLTRNQLIQIMRTVQESDFDAPLQRLNHVVSDLQEGVMKTRMQPVGSAWAKLPRIIRDISVELGKKN